MSDNDKQPEEPIGGVEGVKERRRLERGARLREERNRLGLSVAELARRLDIHRNTQGNYETGREPPAGYLLAIEKMGVDIAYVMNGDRTGNTERLCASTIESIFRRANDLQLSGLNPNALGSLAYLCCSDATRGEALGDLMDDGTIDRLVSAAFEIPEEFYEVSEAVSRLAKDDLPATRIAGLIVRALDVYRTRVESRGLPKGVTTRDLVRLAAQDVIEAEGDE